MNSQTTTPRLRSVIRVFVSSTFSDMKHERSALAAEVYPKLEKHCQKNGFQFQAIDLRWGVSTEAGLDHGEQWGVSRGAVCSWKTTLL